MRPRFAVALGVLAGTLPTMRMFDDDDDGDFDEADPGDGLDDPGVGRAPICGACGVTALPAHGSNVIDTTFVCDNEGCEAYGDPIA